MPRMSEEAYDKTSRFHEAGHAVMAYNLSMRIDFIKMRYIEGNYEVCAVQYVGASSPYAKSVEKLNAMMVLVALAGQWGVAYGEGKEFTPTYMRRFGASEDLKLIRDKGGRYWRDWIADVNYFMARFNYQVSALAEFLQGKTYVTGEEVEQLLDTIPENR
jgi:hypothetical protein